MSEIIEEDIFDEKFEERLSDIKLPATKLELLVKMLRKKIVEYGRTNAITTRKFQELLEATIEQYHERRKHLDLEEAKKSGVINNAAH